MDYALPIILFIIGIILVVKGGDAFVDAASWIAKAAGIPSFIIGATIVSIATTMPEMIVSFIAAAQGKNEMAVGNAVGSVTANTSMIMALAFVFMTVVISRKEYLKPSLILIASATILLLGSVTGSLSIWASILLALCFILFMTINVKNAKKESASTACDRGPVDKKDTVKYVVMFILGAAGIVIGSQFLVKGGSGIATLLKVPERIIAVTLVAIGTSLPELVTTLTAIRKKESCLSIGNIIGANIIDLSLILPICSIISGQRLPVSHLSIVLDMPVCLAVVLLALIPLLIREKASKWQGILMLVVYAGYLVVTI